MEHEGFVVFYSSCLVEKVEACFEAADALCVCASSGDERAGECLVCL